MDDHWAAAVDADELILTGQIFDHAARLRSFEIAAGLHEAVAPIRPHSAGTLRNPGA